MITKNEALANNLEYQYDNYYSKKYPYIIEIMDDIRYESRNGGYKICYEVIKLFKNSLTVNEIKDGLLQISEFLNKLGFEVIVCRYNKKIDMKNIDVEDKIYISWEDK